MSVQRSIVVPEQHVFTADSVELGQIKHVEDAAFALDIRGEPDYWLRIADVSAVDGDRVRMLFPNDELQQHAMRYGDLGMEQ